MLRQGLKTSIHRVLKRVIVALIQKVLSQDVLILVNKGNRDALGLLLVYGYLKYVHRLRVKIHSGTYLSWFWPELYCPRVVIHLSIDCPPIVKMYEELGRMGCTRLMWLTETVVARYNEPFFVGKYQYKHLIEGALLPSRAMMDLLLRHGKISETQAFVVGNPTFDWCVPPLNRFFISRRAFCLKHRLPKERKLILLATSFDWADLDVENYESQYYHFNLPKERVLQDKAKIEKLRLRTIEYLTTLLAKHPDWQLLIKAHPFEESAIYNRAWGSHPRVTPVHGEEIHELIANTDVLVHWNSTTSVQAWGFGKPTVLLNFEETKELYGKELGAFQKGNYVCETFEDLEKALERSLEDAEPCPTQLESRKRFIDEWCYRMDGKSASRIAKIAANLCRQCGDVKIDSRLTIGGLVMGFFQVLEYKTCLYLAWICTKVGFYPRSIMDKLSSGYDHFSLEFHKVRFKRQLRRVLKGKVGSSHSYGSEVVEPQR